METVEVIKIDRRPRLLRRIDAVFGGNGKAREWVLARYNEGMRQEEIARLLSVEVGEYVSYWNLGKWLREWKREQG